ncbi:hypothetical protein EXS74_00430 [Candidatus Woesearchaeota archaeon]|nr:hypothetical protein [Candidatus Woesearchaeota archaeon]
MSRISFDADDVLLDHTEKFILWHNRVHGKRRNSFLRYEQFRYYDLSQVLRISPDEAWGRLTRFYESEEFAAISPRSGSQECVQRISSLGDHVVILTGRPTALREMTKACMRKYFPDIGQVLFAGELLPGPEKLKGLICKKRGIDLHIEDSLEQALDCSYYTGVALLNRPWNKSSTIQLPKNITRVDSWEEVYTLASKY